MALTSANGGVVMGDGVGKRRSGDSRRFIEACNVQIDTAFN